MNRHEILSMEAGCELDALVAEKVMGYKEDKAGNLLPPGFVGSPWAAFALGGAPSYSTYIAAAWQVVESGDWYVEMAWSTRHRKAWVRFPMLQDEAVEAETLPVAICRAALLAVMEADE